MIHCVRGELRDLRGRRVLLLARWVATVGGHELGGRAREPWSELLVTALRRKRQRNAPSKALPCAVTAMPPV